MQTLKKDKDGFTLMEVLIAVLLLAIAIVPMINAFSPGLFSTSGEEQTAVFTNRARATLNRVVALNYQTLYDNRGNPVDLTTLFGSSEEAAKETFSFKGESYNPTVDITDVSGGEGGLLEIMVTLEQVSLKTRKAEY